MKYYNQTFKESVKCFRDLDQKLKLMYQPTAAPPKRQEDRDVAF